MASVKGHRTILTREPGGTPLGRKIREMLLEESSEPISELAELLLFSADRAQHVDRLLRPALSLGHVVVCDRYVHSTYAYQGYARGLPLETLKELIALSTGDLLPDTVLLLDLDPQVGLARAKKRSRSAEEGDDQSWSRFEAEQLSFHTKVRNGFLELATADSKRFVVIDASKSKEAVFAAAQRALETRLPK